MKQHPIATIDRNAGDIERHQPARSSRRVPRPAVDAWQRRETSKRLRAVPSWAMISTTRSFLVDPARAADRGRGHAANFPEPFSMFVVDLTHYLDARGAIAPQRGPARKMADFLTAITAHASDFDRSDDVPGPACFKCRKRDGHRVETGMTDDDTIVWHCPACGTTGRISKWQRTFWDLSQGAPTR
jgi:hypothetical protein